MKKLIFLLCSFLLISNSYASWETKEQTKNSGVYDFFISEEHGVSTLLALEKENHKHGFLFLLTSESVAIISVERFKNFLFYRRPFLNSQYEKLSGFFLSGNEICPINVVASSFDQLPIFRDFISTLYYQFFPYQSYSLPIFETRKGFEISIPASFLKDKKPGFLFEENDKTFKKTLPMRFQPLAKGTSWDEFVQTNINEFYKIASQEDIFPSSCFLLPHCLKRNITNYEYEINEEVETLCLKSPYSERPKKKTKTSNYDDFDDVYYEDEYEF